MVPFRSILKLVFILNLINGLDVVDLFPDYHNVTNNSGQPYYFDSAILKNKIKDMDIQYIEAKSSDDDEDLSERRQLDEYQYFTEDERDCQGCLTRAWNHCRIDSETHICCPPNNETLLCTRELQISYKYCSDFVPTQPMKRFTCMNRDPCTLNNTIYHMKYYIYDIQQSSWGYFGSEWKRYCTYMIQANSSMDGALTLKIPLLSGTDFYVISMPKDEFNEEGVVYKADMFTANTFTTSTDWSYLILYEPTWYSAGYFQFYTYVEPQADILARETEEAAEGAEVQEISDETLEANAAILSTPEEMDTDQLFNNLIGDLYDSELSYDQTFSAQTNLVSGDSDESIETVTVRNEYTATATEEDIVYADKSNVIDEFEWTFPLTVITILFAIMFFLASRYVYQRFITKSLLSDKEQEAAFWTNKTIQKYKAHPKYKDQLDKKAQEVEMKQTYYAYDKGVDGKKALEQREKNIRKRMKDQKKDEAFQADNKEGTGVFNVIQGMGHEGETESSGQQQINVIARQLQTQILNELQKAQIKNQLDNANPNPVRPKKEEQPNMKIVDQFEPDEI